MNKNTKEVSISFTVTNLVLSGFESNLSANHDPDSDSDGTTIVISKDGLPDPTLSINDVSQPEGDSSTTSFTFTISRSGSTVGDVTVDWDTADGSATLADSDYVANTGNTATILNGDSTVDITVEVNGDTNDEGNEQFVVDLSNPTGATISDSQGVGTIENDDVTTTALSIDSFLPDPLEGSPGETIIVTLTGTAFDPTANITLENGSGKTPSVNVSSITDIECVLAVVISDKGTKIGDWELTVTNPDGNSDFVIFSVVP